MLGCVFLYQKENQKPALLTIFGIYKKNPKKTPTKPKKLPKNHQTNPFQIL